jgi:hypothetical protein
MSLKREYNELTYATANRVFSYDPTTGVLCWAVSEGRRVAGVVLSNHFKYEGVSYVRGRIIWLLMTGKWPEGIVDHRDGNNENSVWDNLRDVTYQQNQFNKVGYGKYPKGVVFKADANRSKPWSARIRIDGKKVPIGSYATMEEAAAAYERVANSYQGEFSLTNSMQEL